MIFAGGGGGGGGGGKEIILHFSQIACWLDFLMNKGSERSF